MSVLGYSASYFLPEYWSKTPLYGEKIIPLLDYVLSCDYENTDKLATAFYNMESKYKNTADLPIGMIEAIIDESGYSYIKDLLGNDEDSTRLLVYLLVLIHQLKGTKTGIEMVLGLLKREAPPLIMSQVGSIKVDAQKDASGFSSDSFLMYKGFTTDTTSFEVHILAKVGPLGKDQFIFSTKSKTISLYITERGNLCLSLGTGESWDIVEDAVSTLKLSENTNYYIHLEYDGATYSVKVSKDNEKFNSYIEVLNSTPTNLHYGALYLGVRGYMDTPDLPFLGRLNIAPFSAEAKNINIIEWFEQFPIEDEDTFIVEAELDLGIVSSDFFANFYTFVCKYVYPTLQKFLAKITLQSNLTIIPYARQRIRRYVTTGGYSTYEDFMVHDELEEAILRAFEVEDSDGNPEGYRTLLPYKNN